jgi:enamine deaminase RidA (YjgF/YER057c/UK114 family)
MSIEHINPKGLPPPPGGIYTHLVRAGDHLYISGQLARDGEGRLVGEGDAAAQYRQVWANLQVALADVGLGTQHLVKTTTYVVGEDNIPLLRAARKDLAGTDPPTSTMVVVAALAVRGALVEVDGIAVFPRT